MLLLQLYLCKYLNYIIFIISHRTSEQFIVISAMNIHIIISIFYLGGFSQNVLFIRQNFPRHLWNPAYSYE